MYFDAAISSWFLHHHTPLLDRLMEGVSALTDGPENTLWAALIALVLLACRRWQESGAFFFGIAAGSSLSPVIKPLVKRARPLPYGQMHPTYSFPSGHSLSSMVFFGLLAWVGGRLEPKLRWFYYVLAGGMILWVGLSRVYLGAHWPTDVLGGYVIGLLFLWSWLRLVNRRDERKKIPGRDKPLPP